MIPSGYRFPACAKPCEPVRPVGRCFGGRSQVGKDHAQKQAKAKQRTNLNHFALVQAAVHNAGILRCVTCGCCGANRYRRRRHCGRGWRDSGLRRAVLNRCTCRRLLLGIWRGLTVGDEFCIAGSARPRRHIGGQPAGPMRPVVGDKATAAREIKPKSEQSYRCNEPLGGHKACRMSRARVSIPIRRDG